MFADGNINGEVKIVVPDDAEDESGSTTSPLGYGLWGYEPLVSFLQDKYLQPLLVNEKQREEARACWRHR
ncbi:hypothetical protein MBM_03264 [Drepanopeziza brunnea f. sp. 'multigermtubi' MB_m1]|uniref:Uncharacterized protein n=1 Tax=Marssonina brunnea f. sp. multigermtubi (strain MB_m1) TaxID=1072389 RepID=K1WZ62_MARBU|nr:uncharacterized protein MBM_03264 [Drepanopeziza brunnea f. sp. 'multigermtubi' MB_m1]EKD18271.1 hypothetical protein MBM_03264 [Drepanopeziza brunnea f. sp. 'multigermtubi' MB_m1]